MKKNLELYLLFVNVILIGLFLWLISFLVKALFINMNNIIFVLIILFAIIYILYWGLKAKKIQDTITLIKLIKNRKLLKDMNCKKIMANFERIEKGVLMYDQEDASLNHFYYYIICSYIDENGKKIYLESKRFNKSIERYIKNNDIKTFEVYYKNNLKNYYINTQFLEELIN